MPKFQLHPVRASAIILILFSLGFSIYSFANAWVEPSTTPPGGNIAAPLHTGTTSQAKQGSLSVSAGGIYAQGASYGVYGANTSNGAYGLLGYAGYGGYFNGPTYTNSYSYSAIMYDSNDGNYYSDPNGTSRLNYTINNSIRVDSWDSQLQQGYGVAKKSIGGAYGWDSNMLYINGWGDWSSGVSVGGPGGASRLCLNGNCRSDWPAPADTLQTVTNRGWSTSQPLYTSNYMQSPIFYDTNNSGYYVDPSGSSRMNQLYYVDSAYVVDLRPQYMYDWNDTNYYMDFNNVSILNDLRVNILYDRQNTGYYVDPNGNTRLNNSYTGGFLTNWSGYSGFVGYYGNYIFPGWNDSASWNQSYFIYGNSGNSGLRTNGNWLVDGNIYCASCGGWLSTLFSGLLRLDTWQGNHYSGSDGAEYATIFYDTNNSGYYVDPSGSSRMNQLYYVDSAYVVDLRPQYMYDWNDTNYYMDFNNTSRVNYLGRNYGWNWTEYDWNDTNYYMDLNNVSILNDLRVNILYDRQDTGYYVDPNGSSVFNYAEIKNSSEPTINFHRPGIFATGIKLRSDNRLWFGGWSAGEGAAEIVTGRMLDGNNTGYYVDPNGYSNVYAMQPVYSFNGPVYDYNNGGYYVDPASTTVLNVVYANQYNCMSDLELKKDIKPIDNALDKVLSIKGVSFTWKDEEMGTGNQVGVIAQDVEKVLPEVVTTNEQGLKAVDYSKLTPLIIESIKDLKIEKDQDVNNLREKIDNLETNESVREEAINDLKRRIEALELK